MSKRQWPLAISLIILVLFLSACGNNANAGSSSNAPTSFTIVYQPGLGAATFIILKNQKTLEKQFPDTKIQWDIVNSGSAVREAVISNQGQLGTLGVPPFLVGWDRGMDWRVLLATSRSDSWLIAINPRFKTLKDFGPNDKIGVVAPDAQQAIVLRKAAQQQLGNAHALDRNLVAIGSADGEQALLSGQIAAQLSGSPFQQREIAAGGHVVLHTKDVFGPVGAGLTVLSQSFYNQYPSFSKTVYQDLVNESTYVANHHTEAAQALAADKASGGGGSVAQFKSLLDDTSLVFEKTPSGLVAYATFMKSIGLISKVPGSANDLELPTVSGTGN
ncbi:ABC transporter substrate-binding protein [Dictyobacter arantiisoli]|uniref:Sulfonate ABC transporter substrate-binding protein n=1 Tax=Dictyobacter arantiisoli TaxID=2014874 RepID=A0A5A5T6E7_9CHLR|nr:ABC transporter substrate-binding protein [Dictyobacter arantiisoli]GCF07031.1 sulfonate ABC transporter substrate-binding protein [Dictyobacter arantiisoli]